MMKKILVLIIPFVLLTSCLPNPPPKENRKPDHIRAIYKADPSTSIVIGWGRFEGQNQHDLFCFDTIDHGELIDQYRNCFKPQKYSKYDGVKSAFVSLKNLDPITKYFFVIKNTFGISKRYYFETLSDNPNDKLSIIAGGDSRNNRTPRKAANSLVRKLRPHFVLFGGDMTDHGTGTQWWRWFEDWQLTIGSDGRVTPLVPARGNHERSNIVLERLFWLTSSNYYALNFHGDLLRTYTLNTEASIGGNQTTWLKNDLKNNDNVKWKFAQYHKPMRPHVKKKSEGTNSYKYWSQIFYNHKVKLVFESDAHTVKSTWPIRPDKNGSEGFVRDDTNGTIFVGEGCWGAPLREADDNKEWTRSSGQFNQFKWVFVSLEKVEVRTVKVDSASAVSDISTDDRFSMPEGIELWKPKAGSVVTIE